MTGFVLDPPSGEGFTVQKIEGLTQQAQMKPWSSDPFSTQQHISSWSVPPETLYYLNPDLLQLDQGGQPVGLADLTFKGLPFEPDSCLKPKPEVMVSPNGSSKPKGIRKGMFRKGIL